MIATDHDNEAHQTEVNVLEDAIPHGMECKVLQISIFLALQFQAEDAALENVFVDFFRGKVFRRGEAHFAASGNAMTGEDQETQILRALVGAVPETRNGKGFTIFPGASFLGLISLTWFCWRG